MMTRKKWVRGKELKVHLQNQVKCVQEEFYKPKGKNKVDEIKLSSFNPNSSLDLNSSNRPSEQNDKVEVSPKKIHFGKKENPLGI
jgi:hypothetical protein